MSRNADFSILTVASSTVRLFVSLATLIAFFVAWEFIQASSHVTKVEPTLVGRGIEGDVLMTAYREKGKAVPQQLLEAITPLHFVVSLVEKTTSWEEARPVGFYTCPRSPQGWDYLVARPEFDPERDLINIVRNKFESGLPPAACSISLLLAIDGHLNEEQLSFAADALKPSEYIIVGVSVHNDGNAVAKDVEVSGPEGFQCVLPEPYEGPQCGPFVLKIGEEVSVDFETDEPGLFPDASDVKLASMFEVNWDRREVPDRPRIVLLLIVAVVMTAAIVALEFRRKFLLETWGKILFGIALAALLISIVVFVCTLALAV